MDKLKKFYQNNRIYCILMIISFVCLVIILASVIGYFFSQTSSSVYGHRLDDNSSYPLDNELNEIKNFFNSNEVVKSVNTDTKGRIVYVILEVNKEMANEDIQTICTQSLDKFTKEQKEYYDIQYIVKREDLNPYFGSKSASKTIIAWANFSYNDEEEDNTIEGE